MFYKLKNGFLVNIARIDLVAPAKDKRPPYLWVGGSDEAIEITLEDFDNIARAISLKDMMIMDTP